MARNVKKNAPVETPAPAAAETATGKVQKIAGRRHGQKNQGEIFINYGAMTVNKKFMRDLYRDKKGQIDNVPYGEKGNGELIGRVAEVNVPNKNYPIRVAAFNAKDMAVLEAHAENGRPLPRLLSVSCRQSASTSPKRAGLTEVAYQLGPQNNARIDGNPALKCGKKEITNAEGVKREVPMTQAFISGLLAANKVKHLTGEKDGKPYDFYSFVLMARGMPILMTLNADVVKENDQIMEIVRNAEAGKGTVVNMVADAYFDRPTFNEKDGNVQMLISGLPVSLYEPYAHANQTVDDSMLPYEKIEEAQDQATAPSM